MTEFLEKIKPYFKNMTLDNNLYKIVIQLQNGWGVVESKNEKIAIHCVDKTRNLYEISSLDESVDFNMMIGYIEELVKLNLEVQAKKDLLREKYNELVALFSNHSIEELKTLTFKLSKTKSKTQVRKSKDEKKDYDNNVITENKGFEKEEESSAN